MLSDQSTELELARTATWVRSRKFRRLMNSFEVCRRLKNQPETQTIQILLDSTHTDPTSGYWDLGQGANADLVKSIATDVLLASIQRLLPHSSGGPN